MSTTETLETAISHLRSFLFVDRIYAESICASLIAEVERCELWFEWSSGGISMYPSKRMQRVAELALQLKGVEAMSPEDIVIEALTILDMGRNEEGRLPGPSINNYMALGNHRNGKGYYICFSWGVHVVCNNYNNRCSLVILRAESEGHNDNEETT